MNLERLATRHPILALLLAPSMGALLVISLPFIGWFVLASAIVARLRRRTFRTQKIAGNDNNRARIIRTGANLH
jgi:hypothetical protein